MALFVGHRQTLQDEKTTASGSHRRFQHLRHELVAAVWSAPSINGQIAAPADPQLFRDECSNNVERKVAPCGADVAVIRQMLHGVMPHQTRHAFTRERGGELFAALRTR